MADWKPKSAKPVSTWRPKNGRPLNDTPGPESIAPEPYGPPENPVRDDLRPSAWGTIQDAAEAAGIPLPDTPTEDGLRGAVATLLGGNPWFDELGGRVAQANQGVARLRAAGGRTPEELQAIYERGQDLAKEKGIDLTTAWQEAAAEADSSAAYKRGRDGIRKLQQVYAQKNPAKALGLSVAGSMAMPSPNRGSQLGKLLPAIGEGGVLAAGLAPEAEDIPAYAAGGVLLGAGTQKLADKWADGIRRLANAAGGKVAAAETKAGEMAAEKVAKEIASAKGTLGSLTQEANRAIENLLRLEAAGALSAQQQALLAGLRQNGVLPALEHKLADAMLEKVPAAAGGVDAARTSLNALTAGAPTATQAAAKEILSGGEAKKQVMERLRRYGPTLVGALHGAAGGVTGFLLGGSPGKALIGTLAGAGARPALRATQRMLAHPAVQRGMYEPIQSMATNSASAVERYLSPATEAAARDLYGELFADPEDEHMQALEELLRKRGR